jgi:hypothetical protein
MTTPPFDAKKLQLTKELQEELFAAQAARAAAAGPRKLRRRTEKGAKFVMLPYEQTLAAAGRMKCAVLAVLIELTYQMFKTKRGEVVLTNSMLGPIGISYKAKLRALRQLEAAGMVKVAWSREKRSPRVTVLWDET